MRNTDAIFIDFETAEEDIQQIENATTYFQADTLCPPGSTMTLQVDANLHAAFEASQSLIAALGEAMDKETVNIRSIGVEFQQYDQILADLTAQLGGQ